jgi:hypothetical protein
MNFKNIIAPGFFFSTFLITIGLFGLLINNGRFIIIMLALEAGFLGLIGNLTLLFFTVFDQTLNTYFLLLVGGLYVLKLAAVIYIVKRHIKAIKHVNLKT